MLTCLHDEEEDESEMSPSPPPEHHEETGDNEDRHEAPPRVLTAQELQEKLTAKKESISSILSQLMENPEGNVIIKGLIVCHLF